MPKTFSGTATENYEEVDPFPVTVRITRRMTASATFRLEAVDSGTAVYGLKRGTLEWEEREVGSDGCSGRGAGTVQPVGTLAYSFAGPLEGKYEMSLQGLAPDYPWSCYGGGLLPPQLIWGFIEGRTDSFHIRGSYDGVDRGVTLNETWDFSGTGCKPPSSQKGKGYAKLARRLKAALKKLYTLLDEEAACYRFVVGYRSKKYQADLRRDWHTIADRKKGDNRTAAQICSQLEPRFAQCPKNWAAPDENGKRVALGGPAKESRHSAREAADLKVAFPPEYEWDRKKPAFLKHFPQFQAAARKAKLCGPPDNDKVHVELPYTRTIKKGKGKNKKSKAVFKCWFPPGEAPK